MDSRDQQNTAAAVSVQVSPTEDASSLRALAGDTLTRQGASTDANLGKTEQTTAENPGTVPADPMDTFDSAMPPALATRNPYIGGNHGRSTSTGVHGANDKLDTRPWWKRRRNWPTVAALTFITMSLIGLMVAAVLMYKGEAKMGVLDSYAPPASEQSYIAMDVKVSHFNLETGVGRVAINRIIPYGSYAAGSGSAFLRERVEVFINGNQYVLDAGLPAREIETTFLFTAGQSSRYPFDNHGASVSVYAMTTASRNTLVQALGSQQPLGGSPMVPLRVNVMGGVQSLVIGATLDKKLAPVGMVDIRMKIKRSPLTRLFAVLVMALMWLLSVAVVVMAVDVARFHRESAPMALVVNAAIMFALPTLRNIQPNVVGIGTMGDVLGFYWNMALVAFSFLGLSYVSIRSANTKAHHNSHHGKHQ